MSPAIARGAPISTASFEPCTGMHEVFSSTTIVAANVGFYWDHAEAASAKDGPSISVDLAQTCWHSFRYRQGGR